MRPTTVELNSKTWYRLSKVVAILVLIATFLAPWAIYKPSTYLVLDGIINALIWAVLFFIGRAVILYVLYGKQERTQEDKKRMLEWLIWGTASILLVAGFLAIAYWFVNNLMG